MPGSLPYTGRCACGAIGYEVIGEPVDMNHCQCRQCQLASGTGHSSHLTFFGADVRTTGTPSHWETTGEQGTRKSRAFCGTCGAPVFMTFPDIPELFIVSPATLDAPERFVPGVALWTVAAQPWDYLDPALQRFEKLPATARTEQGWEQRDHAGHVARRRATRPPHWRPALAELMLGARWSAPTSPSMPCAPSRHRHGI